MKVLFNATTFVKGGALQAATSFIDQAVKNPSGISWMFALSRKCLAEAQACEIPLGQDKIIVFDDSPARNASARRALRSLEQSLNPDVVLTLFGPAYVSFSRPHICGVADGYVTHSTFLSYQCLSFPIEWARFFLTSLYKMHWYRKADYWVTETQTARFGLSRRGLIDLKRIRVIANNCGAGFLDNQAIAEFPVSGMPVKILCFSASYKHKNLGIIPHVALALRRTMPGRKIEFVLTLPEGDTTLIAVQNSAQRLGVKDSILNKGHVLVKNGPELMRSCNICFMPTILETFSATYPEAMAMGLPIVASDLAFAREICKDAAIYFKPRNAPSAAEAIVSLLSNKNKWELVVAMGKKQLAKFPEPSAKYQQYIKVINNIPKRENAHD